MGQVEPARENRSPRRFVDTCSPGPGCLALLDKASTAIGKIVIVLPCATTSLGQFLSSFTKSAQPGYPCLMMPLRKQATCTH